MEAALAGVPDAGELRAVVNAAGIYPTTTLADYTEDGYRRIFDVNVLGTLNVTAAAVPRMGAHGDGGAVVNFASIDAFAVSPGQLVYSASQGGRRLDHEVARDRARRGRDRGERGRARLGRHGRHAGGRPDRGGRQGRAARSCRDPEEIADWVWKLASVPGSYLTGETIVISGGLVLR